MSVAQDLDRDLARMAKAMGHPTRVAILRTLARRACICGDLVDELPVAQSTVSQHLKILKDAGLIVGTIDGPRTCYSLNGSAIAELRSVLAPLLEEWQGACDCSEEAGCS